MSNNEYIKLIDVLNNYRSTSLDIAAKAASSIDQKLFDDMLDLYEKMELSKESLIGLQELL